ncbi:MAG: hypothetical protein NWQ13_04650 [Glaciimonas sp.]|nr:hypothetical protein [Glaciimonas sp.]
MKKLLIIGAVGATMLLGGCVAVPYDNYGYSNSYATPVYATPAYGYGYAAPYYAPSVSIGVSNGGWGGYGWRGRHGGWRGGHGGWHGRH